AGLNPFDPTSKPRLGVSFRPEQSALVMTWPTVSGRLYTLLESTNLSGVFVPVQDAVDLPSSTATYTYRISPVTGSRFFRLTIRKPN
ncbi:MAG: hypothetical protein N3G20_08815, partial [Verrucomicrobiae bacterium]|nr:hypothetical protein [Verrucomicrobiae bacterium]